MSDRWRRFTREFGALWLWLGGTLIASFVLLAPLWLLSKPWNIAFVAVELIALMAVAAWLNTRRTL